MTDLTVAEIIARTICEWDRKVWSDLGPTDRHRYFHAARMAQDRIRDALLDGPSGRQIASDLIAGSGQDGMADSAWAFAHGGPDRRLN